MGRKVWFWLVDAATGGPVKGCRPASVLSDGVRDIEDIRTKIHAAYDRTLPPGRDVLGHVPPNRLKIYENRAMYDAKSEPLGHKVLIGTFGGSVEHALIVEVPRGDPVIPLTTPLDDQKKFDAECSSLEDWSVNTVHQIPTICRFMSELGGCTEAGKIFWRLEDKQVVYGCGLILSA